MRLALVERWDCTKESKAVSRAISDHFFVVLWGLSWGPRLWQLVILITAVDIVFISSGKYAGELRVVFFFFVSGH